MKIGTNIMKGLMRAVGALPLGFHYACAGFIAWLLRDVLHYRRDVVMTNLARSFPEKKYSELKKISDRFYRHFADVLAEAIWFGGCLDPERLHRQRLVEYSNIEEFERAYSQGRGVVVLNSHFGNWELMGGCLCYDYRPSAPAPLVEPNDVVFVYKPLRSGMWNEIMRLNRCAPVRRLGYTSYVPSGSVLRHALEHRDRKLVINLPTDQCPYRISSSEETVDFLHQETRTMLGGASLARKLGYSVFYMSLFPVKRGHWEWRFTLISDDASTLSSREIMQRYYDLLSKDIEAAPWCYLWSHKRWK